MLKPVNYQEQAERLADALFTILDTTLFDEWAKEDCMIQGWKVWGDYSRLTYVPPTLEQSQARADEAKAEFVRIMEREKAKKLKGDLK